MPKKHIISRSPTNCFGRNSENKSGSAFFGIDAKYLIQVQKPEIFHLVEHGFDYQSLMDMSIEERRFFFHKLVEYKTPKDQKPQNQPPNIQKKIQK